MKLKLSESAQPISKLEYNIKKNILPKLAEYGLKFSSEPTQINKYKYLYNGVSNGLTNQLYLYTGNDDIDTWNETNSDMYVADLYGELKMNGETEILGPISSKDPSSIDEAMMSINIDKNKLASPKELEEVKIYKPKTGGSGLDPMSKADWVNLKNKLQSELNDIEAQLQKANEENDDETYYNLYKYTYKDKKDYFDRTFIPNYPSFTTDEEV